MTVLLRRAIALVGTLHLLYSLIVSADGRNCPYLSEPEGTNRSSDAVEEGATVQYNCIDQTQVFTNNLPLLTIRCQPSGQWNRLPHPCADRRCPAQHLAHNSIVSTTDTLAGVEVLYRCFYGFNFPDNAATKLITCNSTTLEWDPPIGEVLENITCDQSFCEEFPPPLTTAFYDGMDAYTVNGTIAIGSVITMYCKEGYRKEPDDVQRSGKCAASGNIDGVYTECVLRTCAEMPTPANSTIRLSNLEYHRRVRYECDEGVFPGGNDVFIMECDYNGQWRSEPSSTGCHVGTCQDGWLLYDNNCYYMSNPDSWGLRYYYAEESCAFKKAHLVYINSTEENDFVYSNSYKAHGRDYWIGYHFDQANQEWNWFSNSSQPMEYTKWHNGYPELKDSCARMTLNGVWKDRHCEDLMAYVCKKPTMCPSPPTITNGAPDVDIIPSTMDVGDTLLYKCQTGYSFRSDGEVERLVTCIAGGYYSAIENCQPTMCPPLNRHGYYVKNAIIESETQSSSYLSEIKWTCNIGYVFPDRVFSKTITCQENRTWSSIPDMCIEVHCPLPAILNAQPRNGTSAVGQADYYACNVGYEFPNGEQERMMICQHDGRWIPDESCWKRSCQPYVQYNANITDGVRGVAKYDDMTEITCDWGYQFPDGSITKQSKCGPDFHWTPYLPLCQPKTCPGGRPPIVTNATTNTSIGIINTVVAYTCDEGMTFIDGDTIRIAHCDLTTLQWKGVPQECLDEIPARKANNVRIATALSSAVAGVAIFLIILLIWMIVCTDCQEDRKVIPVCNDCCQSEKVSEDESECELEPEEPVTLQMVM